MSPPLMTSRDAARRCGASHRTFLRLVDAGRLAPKQRFGERGAMLFDPVDVEQLREQLKAEALARFDEPTEAAS